MEKNRDAIQFKNILRIFEREWGLLSALLFIHFRHPGVIQRFCLLTLLKSAGPLNRWDRKKQLKYKILKRRKTEIKHSCLTKYLKKRKKEDTVIMKGKKALK